MERESISKAKAFYENRLKEDENNVVRPLSRHFSITLHILTFVLITAREETTDSFTFTYAFIRD